MATIRKLDIEHQKISLILKIYKILRYWIINCSNEKSLINDDICFGKTKTKEDYILWLKLARDGVEINLIDKKLSSWRKVENSLSSSVKQKLYDGFLIYYKYMKFNFFRSFFCLIRLSLYSILR